MTRDFVIDRRAAGELLSTLLDRDPQAVQADLADGHITPTYARLHHRLDARNLT